MYRNVLILGATEEELLDISRSNMLALDIDEMLAIRGYFKKIGRNPTDCEIETIAQTWSEHCCHKTFKADIDYTEIDKGYKKTEKIRLFKEIMEVTSRLDRDWCLSVFKDNAGVIRLNDEYGLAFKVETHNHPSALEPYGGAGTGIGGVIRDILGVGKGAWPVVNTDVFCLGEQDVDYSSIPPGVLHPRKIFKGVVSGVRDYGNRMGIPTAGGAIIFDRGFQNNPLVFCGTAGIIPTSCVQKKVEAGDYIVAVGGRTGRDGIHGATFSSVSLENDISTSVVQIGNPIVEKKVMDVLIRARDKTLYNSITDCGAGGFSSAVGEMAEGLGAEVFLDRVPLKYEGLLPWEIWISESQERMVLSVPGENLDELTALFSEEDVESAVIGAFKDTGKLKLFFKGDVVCDLHLDFIHGGIPEKRLKAEFTVREERPAVFSDSPDMDWQEAVLGLLAHPNIASKEKVITQYDHEVQARTVLKPLSGIRDLGPSDAVVLKPFYDKSEGVVLSCGINPFYGEGDPYLMAGCCIEEALRNVVAVGGDPEKTAILDNFCWGDINRREELGALVRCVKGCRDYAISYGLPYISGKDSLNNFFAGSDGVSTSIPGTLLISAVSIIPDAVEGIVSSNFKVPGNPVYLCGKTFDELGGSQYFRMQSLKGGHFPRPRPDKTLGLTKKIYRAIRKGLILSCHDCSDGGFIVALSEMIIGGRGAAVKLDSSCFSDMALESIFFSETQGRFITEVDARLREEFEELMKDEEVFYIGEVSGEWMLRIVSPDESLISIDAGRLSSAWRSGLKW